ncbi:YggT family protein [Agaribacter flavus]|uniref:YggT family protein n=1 Tax=Agaribacter flavus TaxID=1902781 RepID=A0ABV7FR82_9ALTE
MNATVFLIETLFNLYLMVIILRIWLQAARADFYNPFSQFVVKATQPVIAPLRRFVPSLGSLDSASLLFAFVVAGIKIALLNTFFGAGFPPMISLLLTAVLTVLSEFLSLLFFILIIRAILSWVSQGGNPIEYVMQQLTEPMLAPIRKIIPPMGGLDLSVLILIIALQFLRILLGDIFGPIF